MLSLLKLHGYLRPQVSDTGYYSTGFRIARGLRQSSDFEAYISAPQLVGVGAYSRCWGRLPHDARRLVRVGLGTLKRSYEGRKSQTRARLGCRPTLNRRSTVVSAPKLLPPSCEMAAPSQSSLVQLISADCCNFPSLLPMGMCWALRGSLASLCVWPGCRSCR